MRQEIKELAEMGPLRSSEVAMHPDQREQIERYGLLIASAQYGSNIFFSPASVMLCLAMVHEVASGETRLAMAKALEIAGLDPVDTELVIDALCRERKNFGELVGAPSGRPLTFRVVSEGLRGKRRAERILGL